MSWLKPRPTKTFEFLHIFLRPPLRNLSCYVLPSHLPRYKMTRLILLLRTDGTTQRSDYAQLGGGGASGTRKGASRSLSAVSGQSHRDTFAAGFAGGRAVAGAGGPGMSGAASAL